MAITTPTSTPFSSRMVLAAPFGSMLGASSPKANSTAPPPRRGVSPQNRACQQTCGYRRCNCSGPRPPPRRRTSSLAGGSRSMSRRRTRNACTILSGISKLVRVFLDSHDPEAARMSAAIMRRNALWPNLYDSYWRVQPSFGAARIIVYVLICLRPCTVPVAAPAIVVYLERLPVFYNADAPLPHLLERGAVHLGAVISHYCYNAKCAYKRVMQTISHEKLVQRRNRVRGGRVLHKGAGSSYGCVPKPILERLGNPKKIRYAIKDDQILISNADSQ